MGIGYWALGAALCFPLAATAYAAPAPAARTMTIVPDLTYADEAKLEVVRASIAAKDGRFDKSVAKVLKDADAVLDRPLDPVTAKTQVPPSGDKHDYMSISPYWWPNEKTPNGLPWVQRDGVVNPATRGGHTDQVRTSQMFSDVNKLWLAYYLTDDAKYRAKLDAILTGWFLDPATRVNPNVNFGQGIPGSSPGRQPGLIEWNGIDDVITAAQVLRARQGWSSAKQEQLDTWLGEFLTWMRTSEIGRDCDDGNNNHSNWYDYKVIGLALHLGQDDVARAQAEKAKQRRIAAQIEPDGSQPHELRRTKSVNYSTMNLRAMTEVAVLAREVDVDLLNYRTEDGRSLDAAYRFLTPFANGEAKWEYQQITPGGVDVAIDKTLRPSLAAAERTLGREMLKPEIRAAMTERLSASARVMNAIPD